MPRTVSGWGWRHPRILRTSRVPLALMGVDEAQEDSLKGQKEVRKEALDYRHQTTAVMGSVFLVVVVAAAAATPHHLVSGSVLRPEVDVALRVEASPQSAAPM